MEDKKSREIYSECKTMYKMFVEDVKPQMTGDIDVEVRMEATAMASVMMKVVNKYFDVVEPLLTTQREIVVNETRAVEVLEHQVGISLLQIWRIRDQQPRYNKYYMGEIITLQTLGQFLSTYLHVP